MPKAEFMFSDTDQAIVAELRKNGRVTNQQIADALGLTPSTVSSRVRRMEEANQLRVIAVADFAAMGYHVLVRIGISVDGRSVSDVAKELAEFPEVFAVHMVTGPHDLDLLLGLHEFTELKQLMSGRFAKVTGLKSMTPSIVTDILKYQFNVAPIKEHVG